MNYAVETTTEIARLTEEIKRGTRIVSLSGLTSIAAKAFVLSELKRETDVTFIVVTDSNKDSETWECDLEFWSRESRVESRESKQPRRVFPLRKFKVLRLFVKKILQRCGRLLPAV